MYLLILFLLLDISYASIIVDEASLGKLVDKNPNVQDLTKRLESAEKLQGRLLRSFLPKVFLTYGREQFSTGPYHSVNQPFGGIEAEINLFNSGKDRIENAIRNNRAEIAKIDKQVLRSKIIMELKKSLSHYAYLNEIKIITKNALSQNEVNLRSAQKRINAGLASSTDLLDFKQQKVQFNQDLASLDYELGVTSRLVNTLVGVNPDEKSVFNFSNSHPDHTDESKLNVDGPSLILKKAQLSEHALSLELNQNKRWWMPTLDAYGYAMRFTQKEREYTPASERNDVTFGLKLTFPIFDGGEGYVGVQATKALVEAQKSQVRDQDLELRKNTLDAFKKLELAHNLIHGAEESVEIMDAYRSEILIEYSKGVKNSPDVLQASQRWIEAKIRNSEVKKNYQFAKADVEFFSSLQSVQ